MDSLFKRASNSIGFVAKITIMIFFVMGSFANSESAEVILDNGDTGTSSTGTWSVSAGPNPYGGSSLYSNEADATYSYAADAAGFYEVSLWWTYYSNRCTSVPVEIYDGTLLLDTVLVDQQTNGGQWNLLGGYSFTGQATVVINSTGGCTTSADAVRFVAATPPALDFIQIEGPLNVIDNSSASYSCRAFYTDGTDHLVDADSWNIDCPGAAEIATTGLLTTYDLASDTPCQISAAYTEGGIPGSAVYDITIMNYVPPAETVLDNGDTGTSSTGTWSVSAGPNPYGGSSLYSNEADATYSYAADAAGFYEVSLWWTYYSNRCTSVPVEIYDGTLLLDTVLVDQQTNGGQWNLLGGYSFTGQATVVINSAGGCTTSADALRFVAATPPSLDFIQIEGPLNVIDNSSASYSCRAFYTDGTDHLVNADSWNIDCPGTAEIAATGLLTTYDLASDTPCQISAAYTEGGTIEMAVFDMIISPQTSSNDTESIYVCLLYGGYDYEPYLIKALQDIGAHEEAIDLWSYQNLSQGKNYLIHVVKDYDEFISALKTPDSHIITVGHSNYGSGTVFATQQEIEEQYIPDVYYMNDDRILSFSSPWMQLPIRSLRGGHGFPFFWPVFKDGTSAIMPYDWNDPRGILPAYNYYITYQVPGDPTFYKVETAHSLAIESFYGSGRPAWYSPDGSAPDHTNPDHLQYFITNPTPWSSPVEITGDWNESRNVSGYFAENYLYSPAGNGNNEVRWFFQVPETANYKVNARWSSFSDRASNSPYTVIDSLGSTTVTLNQRINGGKWNEIGMFNFQLLQDWYESRNDQPSLLTMDEENVAGNNTKKARFEASTSAHAYMTQELEVPQTGFFAVQWDIYVDSIIDITGTPDRAGLMLIGEDAQRTSGPNSSFSDQFVSMAFHRDGGGVVGDTMDLIAQQRDQSWETFTTVASGLTIGQWYTIKVVCDLVSDTYDVYLDDIYQMTLSSHNPKTRLTHISFAQWDDGAGTFYVDNVAGVTPGSLTLLAESNLETVFDSDDLRNNAGSEFYVTLNNNADGGVVADTIQVSHPNNPPSIIQADFYARTLSGPAPLEEVRFYSQSSGNILQYSWNFGDGTTSEDDRPRHTYSNPGTYTVSLTVTGSDGSDTRTKSNYITVSNATTPPLRAEFSAYSRETNVQIAVSFRDRSSGDIVSWLWDFGDGGTSSESQPSHTYEVPGNYTVSLTVTDAAGNSFTETKANFIRKVIFEKNIDNTVYPKTHYGSKTVTFRKELEIPKEDFKYSRMFYNSCFTGNYYLDTFKQGIVFYTLNNSDGKTTSMYLTAYLQGKSDEEIWETIQAYAPIFDYYNFNKLPSEQ